MSRGTKVLLNAAINNDVDKIRELCDRRCNLNLVYKHNGEDVTVLMVAAPDAADLLQTLGAKSLRQHGGHVREYNGRYFFDDGTLMALPVKDGTYRVYTKNPVYGAMHARIDGFSIDNNGISFKDGWTEVFCVADWQTRVNNDGSAHSQYAGGLPSTRMTATPGGVVKHKDDGRVTDEWFPSGKVVRRDENGTIIERSRYVTPRTLVYKEFCDSCGRRIGRYEFSGTPYAKSHMYHIERPDIDIYVPTGEIKFIDAKGKESIVAKDGNIYVYKSDGTYRIYTGCTSFDLGIMGFNNIECKIVRRFDELGRPTHVRWDNNFSRLEYQYHGDSTALKRLSHSYKQDAPAQQDFRVDDITEFDWAGKPIYSDRVLSESCGTIWSMSMVERRRQVFWHGTDVVQHERTYDAKGNQTSYTHRDRNGADNTALYLYLKNLAARRNANRPNRRPGARLVTPIDVVIAKFVISKIK